MVKFSPMLTGMRKNGFFFFFFSTFDGYFTFFSFPLGRVSSGRDVMIGWSDCLGKRGTQKRLDFQGRKGGGLPWPCGST